MLKVWIRMWFVVVSFSVGKIFFRVWVKFLVFIIEFFLDWLNLLIVLLIIFMEIFFIRWVIF